MQSGRLLVNGDDFYCGNSTNNLCQLALKNDLSGIPNKYDRCFVARDASGNALGEDIVLGDINFTVSGNNTQSRPFTFTYDSPYPIWFASVSIKSNGYAVHGGNITLTIVVNEISKTASNWAEGTSDALSFNGEYHFKISATYEYTGRSNRDGYTYQGSLIFNHSYY